VKNTAAKTEWRTDAVWSGTPLFYGILPKCWHWKEPKNPEESRKNRSSILSLSVPMRFIFICKDVKSSWAAEIICVDARLVHEMRWLCVQNLPSFISWGLVALLPAFCLMPVFSHRIYIKNSPLLKYTSTFHWAKTMQTKSMLFCCFCSYTHTMENSYSLVIFSRKQERVKAVVCSESRFPYKKWGESARIESVSLSEHLVRVRVLLLRMMMMMIISVVVVVEVEAVVSVKAYVHK